MSEPFGGVELSPLTFLDRARSAFPHRIAITGCGEAISHSQFADRCERLAGGLRSLGMGPGDVVAVLAPNTRVLLESHFGIPCGGGVINALNVRLSAPELSYIVSHSGAHLLIADEEFHDIAMAIRSEVPGLRIIGAGGTDDEYESLIASSQPLRVNPASEYAVIALNYTSGTTGRPKGVMYSHRGSYLQALAMTSQGGLGPGSRFLWTLPMFHCNGWAFTWAVTAVGGTHVELRKVDPEMVWAHLREGGVTHFNAAPTVLASLAYGPWAEAGPAPRPIQVMTGGAPPSPALLQRMAELNFDVTHLYGLTETYGPIAVCEWQPEWDQLEEGKQARLRARQGVTNIAGLPLRVVDGEGRDVTPDGATLGEVVMRGNNVMLGYFNDPEATTAASIDGWFRSGDVGVMHPDGYVELRDRSKDVIISGGENISSIEVEQALASHPAVLECAVVAAPDDFWGEVPVAFIQLRPGADVTPEELASHVRTQLARFKVPKAFRFGPLPKTGTGKIQKFALRQRLADATVS